MVQTHNYQIQIYVLLLALFFSLTSFQLSTTAYYTKQNYLNDPSYAFCIALDDILIPGTLSHLMIFISTLFTYAAIKENIKLIPFISICLLIYTFYEISQTYSQLSIQISSLSCLDDFETPLMQKMNQGAFCIGCILMVQNIIVLIK